MRKKLKKRLVALALVLAMILPSAIPGMQAKAADTKAPLVRYDMTVDNGKLVDVSGNGNDAQLVGLSASNVKTDGDGNKVLQFNGSGYVKLPDFLNQNQNTITIQMTYQIGNVNNEGLLTLGSKNASTSGNNYLRFHPNQDRTTFLWESEVNNQNNAKVTGNVTYNSGEYATAIAIIEEGRLTYYLNGKKYGTMNMNGVTVQDVLNTCDDRSDTIGFIGRPAWANHDPYFSGVLKSFEVYDYAISEAEILWNTRSGLDPVVDYEMTLTEEGKLKDNSGFGFDALLVGLDEKSFVEDKGRKVLDFADADGYVELPAQAVQGDEITIQAIFKAEKAENSAIWTLGTKMDGGDYVRLHPITDIRITKKARQNWM